MNVEPSEILRQDPCYGLGLCSIFMRISADRASREANRELLSNFSVIVCHDMVRVGVKAYKAKNFYLNSCFFLDFADGRLSDVLTSIMASTWQGPKVVVHFVN
ncbi:hypothetical protein EV191_11294 [Tamaricihabitans halophyticus]|uniref:Uncharacterized protein n=1 Tax=Tamaricihabitans halophyticus TaxID=1262583 RepID=A0A4R2QG44_9PSEU|nr:hypothetical protein EV191_11294 [Tamaricihabitans halophyticus]